MLAAALFAACLLARAANAAPQNAAKVSTSIDSKQTCITKLGNISSTPASLPTSTQTSSQTIRSTITTCNTLSTITTTLTPDAVTSTRFFNGTEEITVIAAPAEDSSACKSTSTVSGSAVTVYTGSYSGNVAKRTAGPPGARSGHPAPRAQLNFNMFHRFGQDIVGSGQKAFAVDCLEEVTTYLLTTTTLVEEPATETETAKAPTVFVTQANKAAAKPTAPVSITSTITAPNAMNTTVGGACTVTAASSTTTQHLKCAPTNLIGSVNGHGIGQTGGSSNTTRGLAPGGDPSACCQLCVDTEGCASSEDDPKAKNCFLWYTTPSCGLGFQYSDGDQDLEPGAGFLVQTGCGTIEGVESFN